MRRLILAVLAVAMLAAPRVGLDPLRAASGVELSIRNGRVWLVSDGATVADVLGAWVAIGHVKIVGAEPLSTRTATLRLSDVAESDALGILLRATGYGFLAVLRPQAPADASTFDRIFIVPSSPAAAGVTPPAPPPFPASPENPDQGPHVQGPVGPVVPGVRRVVGADGEPVPDDQNDGGSPPPRPAPPPTDPPPAVPGATPRPGMIVPPPAQPHPPATTSPPD